MSLESFCWREEKREAEEKGKKDEDRRKDRGREIHKMSIFFGLLRASQRARSDKEKD